MRATGPIAITALLLCAAAFVAVLTAPAGASSADAAAYKRCRGSYNVDGSPSSQVPFYKRIRARNVSCATARSVTRSWVRRSYARSPSRSAVDSAGHRWGCSARFHRPGTAGQYQTVKCARRGGKRVRFRGSP